MQFNLGLKTEDVAMLIGALTLARRYGDTEMFEWAGRFRGRLLKEMDKPSPILEETRMLAIVEQGDEVLEKDKEDQTS